MEWLDKLQVPGLVLAGLVIVLQYRTIDRLTDKVGDIGATLGKVGAVLDLVCQKVMGDRDKRS